MRGIWFSIKILRNVLSKYFNFFNLIITITNILLFSFISKKTEKNEYYRADMSSII